MAAATRPRLAFDHALKFALIRARPNRFIMTVEVDGARVEAHCPATGRIGGLIFNDIVGFLGLLRWTLDLTLNSTFAQPCLVSDAESPPIAGSGKPTGNRRTRYTVEAISLQSLASFGNGETARAGESWIGINQNRSNRFVEYFLKEGHLSDLLPRPSLEPVVAREQMVGKSKIDFVVRVGETSTSKAQSSFIEVKTPLIHLPTEGHPNAQQGQKELTSYHRLVKHVGDLAATLPKQQARIKAEA
jgi:sugar fermentation stimulation protein A